MNSQQLQTAVDKCLAVMVENGCSLKQYHPFFYERFTAATINLLQIQVTRAGLITQPTIQLKEKNT
jgi:hypothetical protein